MSTSIRLVPSSSEPARGKSAGAQTFTGDLTYANGGALVWDLLASTDAGSGSAFDVVNAQGSVLTVQPGAKLQLAFDSQGSTVRFTDAFWNSNHQWTVIDYLGVGTSSGTFGVPTFTNDSAGASLSALHPEGSFSTANVGGDIVLTYSAIPEPAAFGSMCTAAAAMLALRRRRRA